MAKSKTFIGWIASNFVSTFDIIYWHGNSKLPLQLEQGPAIVCKNKKDAIKFNNGENVKKIEITIKEK